MKTLYLTLPIFIFSSTLFGYTCYFREHSGQIRLGHINSRKIYSLFTPHIKSQGENVLSIIRNSNHVDNLVDILNQLLDEYKETISSEQSDVQQLTWLLKSDQIKWIGIEDSGEDINLRFTYNQRKHEYLGVKETLEVLNLHPDWSLEKTDRLLYLIYGADIITYAKNPELFAEVSFVPLEKEHLLEEAEKLFEDIDTALDFLAQLEKRYLISHETYLAVDALGAEALRQRGLPQITGESLIESSEFEDFLKEQDIEEPEVIEVITSYVSKINEFIENGTERNKEVVDSLLHQSGNGIILMGTAHKARIEDQLTRNCISRLRGITNNNQHPQTIQ